MWLQLMCASWNVWKIQQNLPRSLTALDLYCFSKKGCSNKDVESAFVAKYEITIGRVPCLNQIEV